MKLYTEYRTFKESIDLDNGPMLTFTVKYVPDVVEGYDNTSREIEVTAKNSLEALLKGIVEISVTQDTLDDCKAFVRYDMTLDNVTVAQLKGRSKAVGKYAPANYEVTTMEDIVDVPLTERQIDIILDYNYDVK